METQITLHAVASSQIQSIGFDAPTGTLFIEFPAKPGREPALYSYANFTAEEFEKFKAAESIGSHFYKFIKKETAKYPYRRIR